MFQLSKNDRKVRDALYANLIHTFRKLFLDETSNSCIIEDPVVMYNIFFTMLHNEYLSNFIKCVDTENKSRFKEKLMNSLSLMYDDPIINDLITNKIGENIHLFKDLIFKRQKFIGQIAKEIWKSSREKKDLEIWVMSEEIIESELIQSIDKKNSRGSSLNPEAFQYNSVSKKWKPIILRVD